MGGDHCSAGDVLQRAQVRGIELGDGEVAAGPGDEVGGGEVFEAVDDAVGGQDGDAGCVHVDEGHHHGGFGEGGDGQVAGA